jgi:hypothetical protein
MDPFHRNAAKLRVMFGFTNGRFVGLASTHLPPEEAHALMRR